MARLKFYEDEQCMLDSIGFKPRSVRIMNKNEVKIITKKLCRHFKIELVSIRYYGNGVGDSGQATLNKRVMRLDHYPSYRTLIHELSHFYIKDNGMVVEKHHTKIMMRTIKKFAKYVMKKKYWIKVEKVIENEN